MLDEVCRTSREQSRQWLNKRATSLYRRAQMPGHARNGHREVPNSCPQLLRTFRCLLDQIYDGLWLGDVDGVAARNFGDH